jgi:hypothetical protein
MHSVIFVAELTDQKAWRNFSDRIKQVVTLDEHVLRLAENVWLVNLQVSPTPLGWLISVAEQQKMSYGILALDDEPQWLPADFRPKSI